MALQFSGAANEGNLWWKKLFEVDFLSETKDFFLCYQVHESAKMLQAEEALAKKEERKYWNVSEQTMMDLF